MGTAAAAWLIAGVVMARPGIVATRDGNKYQGDVNEKTDSVVVTIHGIDTTLAKSTVDSITYTDSFDTEYANRMSKLAAGDVNGRGGRCNRGNMTRRGKRSMRRSRSIQIITTRINCRT
jgi:hypothetical protein